MIREAQSEDVPAIVRLGSQSLIDGPYAGLLKDTPEQSAEFALTIIAASKGKILVYESDDGKVSGLIGFIIFPHYFTKEPTATEIMWYVSPEERKGGAAIKLLWEAEKEAKSMGATWMGMSAPNAEVGKLYERFGYKAAETTFLKELH